MPPTKRQVSSGSMTWRNSRFHPATLKSRSKVGGRMSTEASKSVRLSESWLMEGVPLRVFVRSGVWLMVYMVSRSAASGTTLQPPAEKGKER